jgi:putative transposase
MKGVRVRGYNTELDLNDEQRTGCMKHAGASRFAYNWGLARSKEAYHATGKRPTAIDLPKHLNALKPSEFPWMYEVSKCAPQEALRDLEQAYKNFFRRVARKRAGQWKGKLGFPKFKKRSKAIGSFRLTGSIKVFSDAVQLPRLGRLRLYERDFIPPEASVLSATISEQAGRWFVSIQVEEDVEQLVPPATSAIGVDLGIKQLATLSDGKTFTNPRALKHAQKRLRRLERQESRGILGGQNRKKTCKKLAKQHARVANIRKDAANKLTTYLCKNHALVAIEDLHVAGMLKNHNLAQAVSDSNFGEIRRLLEDKSSWHGASLVIIDRFYPSSNTCSACGWVDEDQDLSDRVFICHECGWVIDRDLNAARNILNEALRTTGSFSESHAYGESSAGNVNGRCETALVEVGTNHLCSMSTNV